jgi:hypothetical protein
VRGFEVDEMTEQEPLNVRVARALGVTVHCTHEYLRVCAEGYEHFNDGRGTYLACRGCSRRDAEGGFRGYANELDFSSVCPSPKVLDYSNDPSWWGPIIEANRLEIIPASSKWTVSHLRVDWSGPGTLGTAVCEWVCAAFAAGVEIKQGGAK